MTHELRFEDGARLTVGSDWFTFYDHQRANAGATDIDPADLAGLIRDVGTATQSGFVRLNMANGGQMLLEVAISQVDNSAVLLVSSGDRRQRIRPIWLTVGELDQLALLADKLEVDRV